MLYLKEKCYRKGEKNKRKNRKIQFTKSVNLELATLHQTIGPLVWPLTRPDPPRAAILFFTAL